jgi:quercetin dioxygenase-like cupin family protein
MKTLDKDIFQQENVFGLGEENKEFSPFFTGTSYLKNLINPAAFPFFLGNVTFEPGCRNNWHIHNAKKGGGQILFCTAGEGWYQEEGKPAVSLTPGTVISIPVGVKHWHGAKQDSWFSHIAMEVPGEETSTQWLEAVSDQAYADLSAAE